MDNFPFARRTDWRQESNAINKALEELKGHGADILDLTASNPTSCGFSYPEGIAFRIKFRRIICIISLTPAA